MVSDIALKGQTPDTFCASILQLSLGFTSSIPTEEVSVNATVIYCHGLTGQQRISRGLLVSIEHVGQVASSSHAQPVSNTTDRDGGLGPQPGS